MIKVIIAAIALSLATVMGSISIAISKGDAEALAVHFNASIDLTLLEKEGTYSKAQAQQIVKKFFASHPVSKFEVVHVGNSKDGSSFEIGKLISGGKNYRTTAVLKGKGAQKKIHQFRVEDDE